MFSASIQATRNTSWNCHLIRHLPHLSHSNTPYLNRATPSQKAMPSTETTTSGNTQYNHIADAYSKLYPPSGETCTSFPLSILEEHQLHVTLTSPTISIRGKHVLDLACGSGYYSSKFLGWGAASVTGVDISDTMLDAARASAKARGIGEDRLRFRLGDVTDTNLSISCAPDDGDSKFDIVTGCWLLNYASDTATMAKMWTVIGQHLKPGGVFVGLVNQPLLTGKAFEGQLLDEVMMESGAWGKHGQRGRCLETMSDDDGFKVKVELGFPERGDDVAGFDCFYLSNRVYEDGISRSALFEGLEWRDFLVPDSERQNKDRRVGFWNDLMLYPHCRICVASRVNSKS